MVGDSYLLVHSDDLNIKLIKKGKYTICDCCNIVLGEKIKDVKDRLYQGIQNIQIKYLHRQSNIVQ